MSKHNRSKNSDIESILTVARWEAGWEMGGKGEGLGSTNW